MFHVKPLDRWPPALDEDEGSRSAHRSGRPVRFSTLPRWRSGAMPVRPAWSSRLDPARHSPCHRPAWLTPLVDAMSAVTV